MAMLVSPLSARAADNSELREDGVEKSEEEIDHFSHHHRLSLVEPKMVGAYEDDDLCRICGLPILSSLYYTCTAYACKYFLHQQCALRLPQELFHSTHGPDIDGRHKLYMKTRDREPPSPNYTYKCNDCRFETHPLSAVVGGGVEIKIKHRSHPEHQLVAVCRETVSLCDACGRKHKGFFFTCQHCNFWIHQHCTILPTVVMLRSHPQPYILTYSPPNPERRVERCQVCRKPLPFRLTGVYFCPHSATFAHIACCAVNKHRVEYYQRRLEVVELPGVEADKFPSMVIRRYAQTNPLGPDAYYHNQESNFFFKLTAKFEKSIKEKSEKADKESVADHHHLTIERYHKQHPLMLSEDVSINSTSTTTKESLLVCDLCTQPINSRNYSYSAPPPFHGCGECEFVAHKICADILPNITKFFIPYGAEAIRTEIHPDPGKHFFGTVFYCFFCRRPCNGLCSRTKFSATQCIDLECLAAPVTVKHVSHPDPDHLLFRTHHDPSASPPLTCCPAADDTFLYDVYRCTVCKYSVHIGCAMLPLRIRFPQYHRPHPLHLIHNNNKNNNNNNNNNNNTAAAAAVDEEDDDGVFCEVCEEGIDLRYWLYRCVECDESYHVNCIPSVGYLSKVKFGGKLSLPSYVHDHPLTLTRMLTLPSQRCGAGDCKRIIRGMVDEMSFFCSLCHFWLHFSCARNSAARRTSDPLLLYSDVRRQVWIKPTHTRTSLNDMLRQIVDDLKFV